MKDNKDKKALLIIDMQKDFVLPGSPMCIAGALKTIPNIFALLTHFRKNNLPVFYIIRSHRKDGSDVEAIRLESFLKKNFAVPGTKGYEIVDELKPQKDEYIILKKRFSGFMNTELSLILKRLDINSLVVSGTQYPTCVRATIFDAISLNYHVTLITDAASAQTKEIAEANIVDIANLGVNCLTIKEFLDKK